MDRPEKQPSEELLAAYAVGTIHTIRYNEDATDESRCESEEHAYGHSFEYDVMVDLISKKGTCTIGERTLKLIELSNSADSTGCWLLNRSSRLFCEEWNKWIKAEERDLKTYRRLQEKFKGI